MNTYVQDIYHKCANWLPSYIWYVIVAIICCLVLSLIFRKKNICITKTENGKIAVSESALRELITFIAHELGGHGKINIIVNSKHSGIDIDVILKGSNYDNLQEFSHELHEKLHEIIVEKIGISKLKKINIIVSRFALNKNTTLPQTQAFEE